MKVPDYKVIETNLGPMISESRTSVYDVLQSLNEGADFFALCVIHNLKSIQVHVTLEYIEQHREILQQELAEILVVKAEDERYHRAIQAERQKLVAQLPITPERAAYLALREKNRHLWSKYDQTSPAQPDPGALGQCDVSIPGIGETILG